MPPNGGKTMLDLLGSRHQEGLGWACKTVTPIETVQIRVVVFCGMHGVEKESLL